MARKHSAKELLQEALDTIKASYWVQGDEVKFADYYDEEEWRGIRKAIPVPLEKFTLDYSQNGVTDGKVAKVIGVCSIGAMALAHVTLYGEKLQSWVAIVKRDKASFLAQAALAMCILEHRVKGGELIDDWYASQTSVITDWNDDGGREKKEVLAVFRKALKHPLLGARNVWSIRRVNGGGSHFALAFATKTEAKAFLKGGSKLFREFDDVWSSDWATFEVVQVPF